MAKRKEDRGGEPEKTAQSRGAEGGAQELFSETIHQQLGALREAVPRRRRRKRTVSILALLVAGGMVLATILRFLLGL